jgi:hypothetical protein
MTAQPGGDEVARGFAAAGGIIGLLVIAFLNAVACYLVVGLATPAVGSTSDYVRFVGYCFVVGNGLILLTVPVCFAFVRAGS